MTRPVRSRQGAALLSVLLGPMLLTGCSAAVPTPSSRASGAAGTPASGQVRRDDKGIEQVWVPAGSFQMGTDDATIQQIEAQNPPGFVLAELPNERPVHEVRITAGYWIDRYEVTNASFKAFADAGGYTNRSLWSDAGWQWLSGQDVSQLPSDCLGSLPNTPVACVTWYEAEAYARWRGGRLPTEAEWEYAARGPRSSVYPWGDEWDASRCNVVDSTGLKPVGSYPTGAGWVGAQDMAGNVMEWVQDWYGEYPSGPVENPTGPATGELKVERGGWWGSSLFAARSAYRHIEDAPSYGDMHIGFRIASS